MLTFHQRQVLIQADSPFTARFQPAPTHEVPHAQHVATTASGPAPTDTCVAAGSLPGAGPQRGGYRVLGVQCTRSVRSGKAGVLVLRKSPDGAVNTLRTRSSRRWAENRSAGGDSPDRLQRLSRACSFQKVTTRARTNVRVNAP